MDTDGAGHGEPVGIGMLSSFFNMNKVKCAVVPHRGGSISGHSVTYCTTTLHFNCVQPY